MGHFGLDNSTVFIVVSRVIRAVRQRSGYTGSRLIALCLNLACWEAGRQHPEAVGKKFEVEGKETALRFCCLRQAP